MISCYLHHKLSRQIGSTMGLLPKLLVANVGNVSIVMTVTMLTFLLLCLVQGDAVSASTQKVTVKVGNTPLHIPVPEGFHAIDRLSPEVQKLVETMTLPKNRLLVFFVSEGDLSRLMKGENPELGRYMLLHVYQLHEHIPQ